MSVPAVTSRWPVDDDYAASHGVRIEELTIAGEPLGLLFHPAPLPPGCPLTAAQLQVLRHAADGLSNGEIGDQLGVTTDTVKTHLRAVFRRLGARDRANAVLIAMRNGWVE